MPHSLDPAVARVTKRITDRSAHTRTAYLARIRAAASNGPARGALGCANLAHGFAACGAEDKLTLRRTTPAPGAAPAPGVGPGPALGLGLPGLAVVPGTVKPNIAIVSAYNDMLSAHQPFKDYPDLLKAAVAEAGGVAQFAGGVPAMCDGITQGRAGMELSLYSREIIAMATAIALAHDMFDGALLLGVCDKIVPGLVIGALSFGHLPVVLVPAGPMPSGLPNAEKARIRKLFAEGKVGRDELLEAEAESYHSPGTCTFYGTANSNQLLMEVMGLHLPGASFVPPAAALRDALTAEAGRRVTELTALGDSYTPIGEVLDEKAFVNGVVALLASGGSTNHTLHLVAMAAAAGIELTWDDFAELSEVTPLLARVYPNGTADVNHFHAAGGTAFLFAQLLGAGLLHEDVRTVGGKSLGDYCTTPQLLPSGSPAWRPAPQDSGDPGVLRPVASPFASEGGMRLARGNLGRAVVKTSAVHPDHRVVEAPARVFESQEALQTAFAAGDLDGDVVVVVRYQGPKANGMPELHKLTPPLSVLLDRGHQVALVTDGRMSGASGSVPAAIHVSPEAADGGPLARVLDGDLIRFDSGTGTLEVLVPEAEFAARPLMGAPLSDSEWTGTGRELFAAFRRSVGPAEAGARVF